MSVLGPASLAHRGPCAEASHPAIQIRVPSAKRLCQHLSWVGVGHVPKLSPAQQRPPRKNSAPSLLTRPYKAAPPTACPGEHVLTRLHSLTKE